MDWKDKYGFYYDLKKEDLIQKIHADPLFNESIYLQSNKLQPLLKLTNNFL